MKRRTIAMRKGTIAMRKVYWRLLPLTILCLLSCYLDRISVGFAALTMNKHLDIPFTMISTRSR